MTLKSPLTSAQIDEVWIASFRDAATRGGPYRAHPGLPSIQVRSEARGWLPILLPGGSTLFETVGDRDAVLARIAKGE